MVTAIAFDPTGRTLASAYGDDTVKLWEPNSGQLLRSLEGHAGIVAAIAFDPTGRTLASASRDHTVKVWEANSGQLLRSLKGHTGWSPPSPSIPRAARWPARVVTTP